MLKFILLAIFSMLSAVAADDYGVGCAPVHIIVARASTEPVGTGMMGSIALKVQERIPGSDIEALDYPALLDPYITSQTQGVALLTQLVQSYAMTCPNSKIVLMGYSQGAHVTNDVLCGASVDNFPTTFPQGPFVTDQVSAIILMGDPSHLASQSFNQGTSTRSGIFIRHDPSGCDAIAHKMMSFCDADDFFCDSGESVAVHMAYVQRYGDAAADFVCGMVNAV